MSTAMRRSVALAAGLVCHGAFLLAVAWMAASLYCGVQLGRGPFEGRAAWAANALLVAQFPLLHSALLTRRGRGLLARLAPWQTGATLAPTTFATVSSLQLLAAFALWSPSRIVWFAPKGAAAVVWSGAFAASWGFLALALHDGKLGLQTGWIGWTSLWRGRRVEYGGFPERGTFRLCRQPIYLGFGLTLWTGPVWTPDHLALALAWTLYCVIGPLHKERRFLRAHGDAFAAYRARVPYFLPRMPS